MRVLPPGGPPRRVSSGPFPGAELHFFCKAKPVKLKKVAFSHFFDTLGSPLIPGGLMSLFSVFRLYILYRLLMARFFLRQLALQLCLLCLQLAFRLFQRFVILRVIRGLF